MEKIDESGTSAGPVMSNQGQIVKLQLPPGWVLSTVKHSLPPTANFVEFHRQDNKDAKLCTYYRGRRVSPGAGRVFHALLAAEAHELSDDEYLSIGEVLRDKAKEVNFSVSAKNTIVLNGRTVLLVEGRFKEIKQIAYAVYIDAEGTGEVVQELFYQAPEAVFQEYFQAAKDAISSVVWK